jgi:hypothetical protein
MPPLTVQIAEREVTHKQPISSQWPPVLTPDLRPIADLRFHATLHHYPTRGVTRLRLTISSVAVHVSNRLEHDSHVHMEANSAGLDAVAKRRPALNGHHTKSRYQ